MWTLLARSVKVMALALAKTLHIIAAVKALNSDLTTQQALPINY